MKKIRLMTTLFGFALLAGCAASGTSPVVSATDAASSESTVLVSTPAVADGCTTCASGQVCVGCAAAGRDCTNCAGGAACTSCHAPNQGPGDLTACAGCLTYDAAEARGTDPHVATVHGTGMTCPMCGAHAQKRLGKLDGVEWVNVDLQTGDIFVGLDENGPTPDAQALQEAVREAGFTPGEVTLPPVKDAP